MERGQGNLPSFSIMDIQKISDLSQLTDGMLFEVTQADIDEGTALNCRLCPVSRALKRHFAENIIVETGQMVILRDTHTHDSVYINNQYALKVWIHDYDQFWLKHRTRVGNPMRLQLRISDEGNENYYELNVVKAK